MRPFYKVVLTISLLTTMSVTFGTVLSASHYSQSGDVTMAPSADIADNDVQALNTTANDGCPYQAPDGLSRYIASNRPGGHGGLDIWVARRTSTGDPWGELINLPFDSSVDDFCPSSVQGRGLLFVSRRYIAGVSCDPTQAATRNGQDTDIYFVGHSEKGELTDPGTWGEPQNVGCEVNRSMD
jgi:hypothetical protein